MNGLCVSHYAGVERCVELSLVSAVSDFSKKLGWLFLLVTVLYIATVTTFVVDTASATCQ